MTEGLVRELNKIAAPERVKRDEFLSGHCSFRTGGPADLFVQVCTEEELVKTLELLEASDVDVFLLGRGTNLLIGDKGFRGAVVTMCAPSGTESDLCNVKIDGCRLRAGAGASLLKIAMAARDAALAGFEFAAGIPGSLGGAVMMNAGAYGGEMKDVVRSVRIFYPGSGIRELSGEEMNFGYRTSRLKQERGIVLSAEMELEPGDSQKITERITELAQKRMDKQPLEYASAGSTFKRPEGYFAGKLIQDAGLMGFSVGDAQVSEKHAGFVINRGNASAAQIRELIEKVQRVVLEDSGVQLEREVIFLGEF
ncbi:MAG: UDP-N-acetylmuramate dehydrogenase [Lachnospiraceae bacterium]|nr:UDP-N-acetylmuramate dehydrogenase [Lachnospiraceae bacterium]